MASEHFILGFFRYIINPFKYPANSKAKKRFVRYENVRLKIIRRKTMFTKQVFYVPQVHNVSYFRAEKAMMLLMLKSNYKVLKKVCPTHIDIFYDTLASDLLADETNQVDMFHVFTLIQYFLIQNPIQSIKNILKYHIMYELLTHCEYRIVVEILIGLITPGDSYFRLEDNERKILSDYLEIAKFGEFFVSLIENFKLLNISDERLRVSSDPQVNKYIESLSKETAEPSEKNKSFLLNYFHSLFNKSLMTKFHKQPEDIYTRILNIDRLPNKKPNRRNTVVDGAIRKLVRSSTMGNLDNMYDIIEGEELNNDDLESKILGDYNKPSGKHLRSQSTLILDLAEDTDKYLTSKTRKHPKFPKKSSKLVKSFHKVVMVVRWMNLIMKKPQMKTKLKNERKAKFLPYPENIPSAHPEFRNTTKFSITYIESLKLQEKYSSSISEVVYGIVNSALVQKTHQGFNQMIRLVPGNLQMMNKYLFKDHNILVALLKCYLMKINYWMNHQHNFQSAYWAAKSFNLITKNM